jgi:NitT/TauT family transport system substrate-binding protein
MLRKFLLSLSMFLILVLLVSCGVEKTNQEISSQEKQTISTSQEPLQIAINSWIGHGLYFVAKEKGMWEKEGVEVELNQVDDFSISRQLLRTSAIDAVSVTPESVQILNDTGISAKLIMASDNSVGADGIIANEEIKNLKDLKGKRVAFEPGSPSHLFLSYVLDQEGMTTNDLEIVSQPAYDAGATFLSGNVDAAVTWEPWLSQASDRQGGHLLASTKNLPILPAMPFFREEVIKNKRDDVKAFMRGLFAALDYIENNLQESYEIIANGFGISVEDVTAQLPTFIWYDYEENLEYFSEKSGSIYELIDKSGDLWKRLGLISQKADSSQVIDQSLLKELYK